MTKRSKRWVPVANAVTERMAALGWHHHADLYRASGLSEPTARPLVTAELRAGQEPTVATRKKVASALGWSDDSIDLILRGEDPVVLGPVVQPADIATRLAAVEREMAALRQWRDSIQELAVNRVVQLEAVDGRVAVLEARQRGAQ